MAAPATLLYRLQVIDLALTKNRARLQQIETTLGEDVRIQTARAALVQAESALAARQTHARDLDLEIKGLAEKIATAEKRLYSGAVTNPKEMSDIQSEVESLTRRQAKLDDDSIEALLYVEQEQNTVQAAREALDTALAAFAESKASLIAEKTRLETEEQAAAAKRATAAAGIDPALLARYEALRPKKRGMAVALLTDGSCTVCGVEQTAALVQQVKAGIQVILCANCGRILSA